MENSFFTPACFSFQECVILTSKPFVIFQNIYFSIAQNQENTCSLFENLYQINIIKDMAKALIQYKKSLKNKQKRSKNQKNNKESSDCPRSKKKSFQFLEILKCLNELPAKTHVETASQSQILLRISQHIMTFFNKQKGYTLEVLNLYFICLAKLLRALGKLVRELCFSKEFIKKIKHYAINMVNSNEPVSQSKQKLQALLYILAALIREENKGQNCSVAGLNKQIYNDKVLVKTLLTIAIIKDKKISKLYGYILIRIANQQQAKRMKQAITKSILLNLARCDHEATFFNLLVFLRNQRNRIKIDSQDVVKGNFVQTALQSYQKYINRMDSFQILNYLRYILHLFPEVIPKIQNTNKHILNLMRLQISQGFKEIHQSIIVSCIQLVLKYSLNDEKQRVYAQITKYIISQRPQIALKMSCVFAENDIPEQSWIQLTQVGYFKDLLDAMSLDNEINFMKQIRLFKTITFKISQISTCIGGCLRYLLIRKLKIIKEQVPHNWRAFRDHIDQFLI